MTINRRFSVRLFVSVHLALLFAQPATATAFLGGLADVYLLHAMVAWWVLAAGALQAVVVLAAARQSFGPVLNAATLLIVVGEAVQIALGQAARTGEHLVLGTTVWGLSVAVAVFVWAPAWQPGSTRS